VSGGIGVTGPGAVGRGDGGSGILASMLVGMFLDDLSPSAALVLALLVSITLLLLVAGNELQSSRRG